MLVVAVLPCLAWPTALALVIVSMLRHRGLALATFCRRVTRAGTLFDPFNWFYLRKWMVGLATEVTLETLSVALCDRVTCALVSMLGTKIGKGTEISTNLAGRYDLVDIGANNFIGDEYGVRRRGAPSRLDDLRAVKTGDRVFFGQQFRRAARLGPRATARSSA